MKPRRFSGPAMAQTGESVRPSRHGTEHRRPWLVISSFSWEGDRSSWRLSDHQRTVCRPLNSRVHIGALYCDSRTRGGSKGIPQHLHRQPRPRLLPKPASSLHSRSSVGGVCQAGGFQRIGKQRSSPIWNAGSVPGRAVTAVTLVEWPGASTEVRRINGQDLSLSQLCL